MITIALVDLNNLLLSSIKLLVNVGATIIQMETSKIIINVIFSEIKIIYNLQFPERYEICK